MKKLLKLAVSILLCEASGIIGSVFTFSAIPNWYRFLEKPALTPPGWLFGPVWTILYLMMGIYFYILWENKKKQRAYFMRIFLVQLFFNFLWSIVFFGLKQTGIAVLIILIMDILVAYLVIRTREIHSTAGWLLAPYLVWISFATYLNTSIWLLN